MKAYDFTDEKDRALFYKSKMWRATREAKLREHPLCEMCSTDESPVMAQEVHHITDLAKLPTWENALDPAGLQCLCTSCHAKHTYADHMAGTYKKSVEVKSKKKQWKKLDFLNEYLTD